MNRTLILIMTLLLVLGTVSAETEIPGDRFFYIQSVAAAGTNNGYWDLPGYKPSFRRGANLAMYEKEEGNVWDRLYMFKPAGDGYYYIMPANGGYVDVAGGRTSNGTNICIWDNHGGNNQKFRLEYLGSSKYKIFTYSGQVICASGRQTSNGSNVCIWEDHETTATEWYLIQRGDGLPYHPIEGVQPFGRVTNAKTGAPVPNASICITNTNDNNDSQYWENSDGDGNFKFDVMDSIKYGYHITVSADGYGSASIPSHKQYDNGPHTIELTPSQGYKEVEFGRYGTWLYEKSRIESAGGPVYGTTNSYYSYLDGETVSRDHYFFYDNRNRTRIVLDLMDAIGLDRRPAETDEEIYNQLSKVWNFWVKNSHSIGFSDITPENQEAMDFMNHSADFETEYSKSHWPAIEDYAKVYEHSGFIPSQNCTSHTLAFASLMTLTGIPRSKMAVEAMHMTESFSGEHWAFLIRLNGIWYWIDPQYKTSRLSPLENFTSIPANTIQAAYDKPFKIYTLPGSEELSVPLCGWKVRPERETGVYWDPASPHLKYSESRFGGTEPFWSLDFDEHNKIFFTPYPGGPTSEFVITETRELTKEIRVYGEHVEMAPWMQDGKITVMIKEEPSTDGMSDNVYPYSITVFMGQNRLYGTGTEPFIK
ncbi:MAG: RICIN domain-containing protein [Spirochaetales bacterium]|nr:RICIN domain-containing protein [Spirochaetales bacterium]